MLAEDPSSWMNGVNQGVAGGTRGGVFFLNQGRSTSALRLGCKEKGKPAQDGLSFNQIKML